MYNSKKGLIDMIDSCFTYGNYEEGTYSFEKYLQPYKDAMGEKKFNGIYNSRIDELKSSYEVHVNVGTDSEGVTYNSLVKIK